MADVSQRGRRGQLIIVTALVLAVLFVALALVLNSAIFTENLSTRETGSDSREVLDQRAVHSGDVQAAIAKMNSEPTSEDFSIVNDTFDSRMESWSNSMSGSQARVGQIAGIEVNATEGAKLSQADEERNFTAGDENAGESDWTLAEDATDAGTFQYDVSDESLLDVTGEAVEDILAETDNALLGGILFYETFHVEITNTTDPDETWRLYFFQDGANAYVYVEEPDDDDIRVINQAVDWLTDEACGTELEDGTVDIDIRNAEVGGEHCEDLTFYADEVVGNDHEIAHRNADTPGFSQSAADELVDVIEQEDSELYEELEDLLDSLLGLLTGDLTGDDIIELIDEYEFTGGERGTGAYDIVVDTSGERENFYDVNQGEPSAQTVVYSADVTLVYERGNVKTTSEATVRWEEAEP